MNGPNAAGNYTEFHYKSHHGDYVSSVFVCDCMKYRVLLEQDGPTGALYEAKMMKNTDNPFVDNGQRNTMVDMKGGCLCLLLVRGNRIGVICFQMLWC